jgi:hypothetical protein
MNNDYSKIILMAEKYSKNWRSRSDWYWLYRLLQEVFELIGVMLKIHKHTQELELTQIASICANWLNKNKIVYRNVVGLHCSIHMHLNVRQFITRPLNQYPKGLFTKDDGSPMTNREAREALLDELQQGHVVIPCGQCNNFDYSGVGCLGHPVKDEDEKK